MLSKFNLVHHYFNFNIFLNLRAHTATEGISNLKLCLLITDFFFKKKINLSMEKRPTMARDVKRNKNVALSTNI